MSISVKSVSTPVHYKIAPSHSLIRFISTLPSYTIRSLRLPSWWVSLFWCKRPSGRQLFLVQVRWLETMAWFEMTRSKWSLLAAICAFLTTQMNNGGRKIGQNQLRAQEWNQLLARSQDEQLWKNLDGKMLVCSSNDELVCHVKRR